MKEPIVIVLYEDDGQIDVEVYGWDERKEQKTQLKEAETHYAIQTKEEANEIIDALYATYEVMKITSLEEEEEAEEIRVIRPLPSLAPKYLTYEYSQDELLDYITNWYYQTHGLAIPFYFGEEDEKGTSVYLYVDTEQLTERARCELERTTHYDRREIYYDFADEILERIFNVPLLYYRNDPYENNVSIHIPLEKSSL